MGVVVVRQIEELWHVCRWSEALWFFSPMSQPFLSCLTGDVPQAWSYFALRAGNCLWIFSNLLGFFCRLRLKS